jgi:gluconolactonase
MEELYDIRDRRFTALILMNVGMETLWTGARWAEGPAYHAAGRYLVFSDIPNDRLLRWDEGDGRVSVFQQPAGFQNGHTIDRQGRLVCCEHLARCVSRVEHDGRRVVLASHYQGKRLNSPNDVVVKSDGSIWFSDPTYGIDSEYEGDKADSEIGASNVYRIDPDGTVDLVIADRVQPNGLAFSPDESVLYVADSGQTHDPSCAQAIHAYPVDGAKVGRGVMFCESDCGFFDGFRLDRAGNLWTSAGDGVHCFASDGTLLGKILTGEGVANVCFGGPKRNRLFICATTSLRSIYLNTQGVSYYG